MNIAFGKWLIQWRLGSKGTVLVLLRSTRTVPVEGIGPMKIRTISKTQIKDLFGDELVKHEDDEYGFTFISKTSFSKKWLRNKFNFRKRSKKLY